MLGIKKVSILKKLFFPITAVTVLSVTLLSGCFGSTASGNNNTPSDGETDSKKQIVTDGTFVYEGSSVRAANSSISGDIVIPSEYEGTAIDTIKTNAFKNCTGITSVTVPDSVTSIGTGAFSGCSQLRSITIPFVGAKKGNVNDSGTASFGYIFGENSYEGGIRISQQYSSWNNKWFYIPSQLRNVTVTNESLIGYGAFQNCSKLTAIDLNDEIVSVAGAAFENCSSIKSINVPNISSVQYKTFSGCSDLETFTIGADIESIGSYAFKGCTSLSKINSEKTGDFIVPNTVQSIGIGAFSGCVQLKSITLPFVGAKKGNLNDDNGSANFGYIFGEDNFEGGICISQRYSVYNNKWFYIPSLLRSVTVTSESRIGYGAFNNCSMLTQININQEAKNNVGTAAFENCIQPTYTN